MFAASKTDGVTAAPSGNDPYWSNVSLLTNFENNLSFQDESTNNFAITRNGVVNPSLNSPFSGVGGSEYFNGSTGTLTAANNAAFQFGSGNFTIEFWFYPRTVSGIRQLINPSTSGGGANNTYAVITNGTSCTYYLSSTGSTWDISSGISIGTVALNTWYHVALVRNGTTITPYLNGISGTTTTSSSSLFAFTSALSIGGYNGGITDNFFGNISNLRIVKGTAIYTANFTPPTAPLTAITNTSLLITGTGQGMFNNATFVDQGPNALTVTATGAPVYSGLSPFGNTYPGSVLYNGSTSYLSTPNNTSLQFGTGSFTIEFWYLRTGTNGQYARYFQLADGDVFSGIGISQNINTQNSILIAISSNGTSYDIVNLTAVSIIDLAWNHVALVRNGTNFTVYINGVGTSLATSSASIYYTGTGSSVIGGQSTPSRSLAGVMSNFRVVKGTAVYTANFTPSTTPLTAITNTSLLVRGDTGAFYDLSNNGLAETGVGSPVVTTQVKKFGSESGFFNGSSSYLTMPMNTAFDFGAGDFTIEVWAYLTATPSNYKTITGAWGGTTNGWILAFFSNTTKPGFQLNYTGTPGFIAGSTAVTLNTWNHIAVVRSGTTATLYLNGISTASSTGVGTLITAVGNVAIGTNLGDVANQAFPGYLDDIRITKGVARYTANFTPPTATFPTN